MNLKKICMRSFPHMIRKIKQMEPHHDGLLFDKIQYRQFGESDKSYVGTKLCGEACFAIHGVLMEQQYDLRVYKNSRRCGRDIDDHCFILVNGSIIVDPTYRQFIKPLVGIDEHSRKFLYETLPPIFVGDLTDLKKIITDPMLEPDDLSKYWIADTDITYKFSLSTIY